MLIPNFPFNNLFEFRFFCPAAIQTSVFQMRTPFFTVNYLLGNFFENFFVPNSKFEREQTFIIIVRKSIIVA